MNCISSDTNIWIDFSVIDMLHMPFKLPFKFIMYNDALKDELINPPELIDKLTEFGLKAVSLIDNEFQLAYSIRTQHSKLSGYDAIALSIAMNRQISLATGDRRLRKVAESKGVRVIGSIGIVDMLYEKHIISPQEALSCFSMFKKINHKSAIRMPDDILQNHIEQLLQAINN